MTPAEPAAPSSRRGLVRRRRESWIAAAWREIVKSDDIAPIVGLVMIGGVAVSAVLAGAVMLVSVALTVPPQLVALGFLVVAGVVLCGVPLIGALLRANASRRYIDEDADG